MNIVYAVLSRGRPQKCAQNTLTALKNAGVDPKNVHLWIDEDEYERYIARIPDYGLEVKVGPVGTTLMEKRNRIARHYPVGTRLVECDDDVSAYWYANKRERPLLPLKDLPMLAEWAFTTCDRLGLGFWGLYPIDNPFFMRPMATTDLRLCTGPTWGFTVAGDDTELVAVDHKEDSERTIRFAIRDGGVLRINWATFSTSWYAEEGGMGIYRTDEDITDGALTLAAMFPDHARLRGVSKRGKTELTLVRGTPVCAPIPVPKEWA